MHLFFHSLTHKTPFKNLIIRDQALLQTLEEKKASELRKVEKHLHQKV